MKLFTKLKSLLRYIVFKPYKTIDLDTFIDDFIDYQLLTCTGWFLSPTGVPWHTYVREDKDSIRYWLNQYEYTDLEHFKSVYSYFLANYYRVKDPIYDFELLDWMYFVNNWGLDLSKLQFKGNIYDDVKVPWCVKFFRWLSK